MRGKHFDVHIGRDNSVGRCMGHRHRHDVFRVDHVITESGYYCHACRGGRGDHDQRTGCEKDRRHLHD